MGLRHTFSDFYYGITQRLRDYDEDKRKIVVEVSIQALSDAITLSPVDTGRYRAAHDLTIDAPSQHLPAVPKRGSTSANQMSVAVQAMAGVDFRKKGTFSIYLTNNLVYAGPLEVGHSKQAPSGVYGIVRERAEANLRKAGL